MFLSDSGAFAKMGKTRLQSGNSPLKRGAVSSLTPSLSKVAKHLVPEPLNFTESCGFIAAVFTLEMGEVLFNGAVVNVYGAKKSYINSKNIAPP